MENYIYWIILFGAIIILIVAKLLKNIRIVFHKKIK